MEWRKITFENAKDLERLYFDENMPIMIAFERSKEYITYDHKKHIRDWSFVRMAEDGRFYYMVLPKLKIVRHGMEKNN